MARVLGYPLVNYVWVVFILIVIPAFLLKPNVPKQIFWAYSLALCLMTLRGALQYQSPFFTAANLVRDGLFSSGVVGGVAFGALVSRHEAIRFEKRIALIAIGSLAIVQIGVMYNILTPTRIQERELDPSQYSSSYFALVLIPIIWFSKDFNERKKAFLFRRGLALGGIIAVATFSVVSATRTTTILLLVTISAISWISSRHARAFIAALVIILFSFVQTRTIFEPLLVDKLGLLGARFSLLQDARSEVRIVEIEELFDQMSTGDFLIGKGYGVGFLSSAAGENLQYTALNPHIGVFSLLQKGGIGVFIASLIPCVIAAIRIFRSASNPRYYSLCFGVLFFFVCAAISGGWYFTPFFLLGYCLSRLEDMSEKIGQT